MFNDKLKKELQRNGLAKYKIEEEKDPDNLLPGEDLLDDDYLLRKGHIYIIDYVITQWALPERLCGFAKKDFGYEEIRSCRIFNRPDSKLGKKLKRT